MIKDNELEPKRTKKTKKPQPKDYSWVGRLIDKLAKIIAYLLLFTSATYGIRQFLGVIPDWANVGITSLLVLAMVYIIFRNK
jgi:hypothetical protein